MQDVSYPKSLNGMNSLLNCMNQFFIILLLLQTATVSSQDRGVEQDSVEISAQIDLLFDAMRSNDSSTITQLFTDVATLSSVYTDKNSGQVVKRSTPAQKFVTAIGTPHVPVWDEQIWTKEIMVDGVMAIAWTEYTFYLDHQLSHCGVNVFEMMKTDLGWQISSVTDTRRRDNCQESDEHKIHEFIDNWHKAAAVADEDTFFGSIAEDGIYIGTDATERWSREEMFTDLGQHFQKESAWDFTAIERHVTMSPSGDLAWFDELLDTWMGTCRSSGVVQRIDGSWQIAHYHLSIAVPNDKVDDYLESIGKERRNK